MSTMSTETAFFFPGQGAQFVGMGRELLESSPRSRRLFELGSGFLDLDLIEVVLKGPEETLNSTRVSQPAIFLLSMAVLEAASERSGGRPFGQSFSAAATAGLSLGEYSALVFAGSLEFGEALKVVVSRGEFMQEACGQAPGGMASLLGLELSQVEEVVARARAVGRIGVANYNSPNQMVVSGDRAAVEEATKLAMERGCRRAIPLRVAGAYHSSLMASATQKLTPILEDVQIRRPRCPFYSNVTGSRVEDPEEIRQGLISQVESSVRWLSIVRAVIEAGARDAYEVGPGKVIAGLVRSIDRRMEVRSVSSLESVEALFGD